MPKPHFTINKKVVQAIHGNSSRERLLHRLHAVVLALSGLSAVRTARIYGDSSRSVAYWIGRFKEQGIQGLEEEARPGRPSKLNAVRMKKVQAFVQRSHAKNPVTAKMLSEFLSTKLNVVMTPRQCWRILKKLKS